MWLPIDAAIPEGATEILVRECQVLRDPGMALELSPNNAHPANQWLFEATAAREMHAVRIQDMALRLSTALSAGLFRD
jgi:hypothetical protein